MAKERLSKLQKRTLVKAHGTLNRLEGWENGFLFRREIVDDYFGKTSVKAEASTSRAIRNLIDKGLITGFTPTVFSYGRSDLSKMLKFEKKPDFATLLQGKISKETKDATERLKRYNEQMAKYKEQFRVGEKEKLILPATHRKDTIKVISLTKLGKEAVRCLKLSNDKKAELNNKDIKTA